MLRRHMATEMWNSREIYETRDVILEITNVQMVFENKKLNETLQVVGQKKEEVKDKSTGKWVLEGATNEVERARDRGEEREEEKKREWQWGRRERKDRQTHRNRDPLRIFEEGDNISEK